MKTTKLIVTAVALLGFVSTTFATSIYFDDFATGSQGFIAADRYQASGIIFNQQILIENVQNVESGFFPFFTALGGTAPNAIGTDSSFDMTFVLPGTSTPAFSDSVSMLFMDTEVGSTLGTIQAYDINNNLLATSTLLTPTSYGAVLQVNAPGIARVTFSTDIDGALLDNLTFGTPVPEPSSGTLLLGGAGIVGLAVRRIQLKKQAGASAV